MNAYFLPGIVGLLLGLLLHWTGFSRAQGLRQALGLRRSYVLRSGLTALGWAIVLTALLMWLAVIDVDEVRVLPLSAGALLGGTALGVAAGLCGFTPTTAFAGLGAGKALEALCVLAGCLAGAWFPLENLLAPLRTAPPYAPATLFEVTLDEMFLLGGGFLGQGCTGLLLVVIAMAVPSPKPVLLTEAEIIQRTEEAQATSEASTDAPSPSPEDEAPVEAVPDTQAEPANETEPSGDAPEDAATDTFVSLQEGEEPLIIDTDAPDSDEEKPQE